MTIPVTGSDALAAKASAGGAIAVSVWGRIVGSNSYLNLVPAAGLPVILGTGITTYYTPGGSVAAIISLVQMANTMASAVTVTTYAQASMAQTQTGVFSIPANGRLEYADGWKLYDGNGNAQTVGTAGPQGIAGIASMAIALEPDQGEEGMPVPGPVGNTGATGPTGQQGPIGSQFVGMDPDQGEEGMPVPSAISLGAVGSSPNANAATLLGQALALQPASASFPGVLSASQFAFLTAMYGPQFINVQANAYSNLKCDGVTDDAAALNTLYTNAPDHSLLVWPNGTMVLSTTVSIPSGKHFAHQGAGNQKTFWTITSSTADMVSVGDWQNTFNGISFNTAAFTITGNQAITGSAQTLNITSPGSLLPASGVCTIPSSNAGGTATVWVVFTITSRTSTTITGSATGTGAGFTGIPFGGAAVAGTAYFRSAGYFINGGSNVDIFITGCDFTGGFNGVLLNGTLCSVRDCQFSNMINFDMQFNGANVNSVIDNITCDGSPPSVARVEVNQCGSLLISNCDIIRGQTNLRLNPTSPNGCFGVYAVNTYFDTATAASGTANSGNGVLVQGTGNVQRIKFTNYWLSSAAHDGFWCNSTATTLPTDFEFLNCNIYSNGVNGIEWAAGQDFIAIGNQIAGNVTTGILLAPATGAVTLAHICNNRIGPAGGIGANGTGINIPTGTYLGVQVRGNDLLGSTTPMTVGTVTVGNWTKYAITDNPGYNPHGAVTTPTFPTSTTVVTNTTGLRVTAFVKSGATAPTVITYNGVADSTILPAVSALFTFPLDPGGTIAFTFTVAPTWSWFGN